MCIYCVEGPTWSKSALTCSFADAGGTFTNSVGVTYQTVIQAALARWSQVANVTFSQVSDGAKADIRIGWGSFSGGQIGETNYSFTQGNNQFVAGTTVRLEDPSLKYAGANSTATYSGTATTLYQVALHEIGHALGLAHDTDPNSVMYATLGTGNRDLDSTDIDGIQALFGPAPTSASISPATVAAVMAPGTASAPPEVIMPSGAIAVYRFFDNHTGTQFLTGSVDERNMLIATRSDLKYEGLGMGGIASGSSDPNTVPVYRFFDTNNGTHFFTTSATEVKTVATTRQDMVAEGANFMEHATQQAGDNAVYRFFNAHNGTHFFTSSGAEQATIMSTRPDMAYEGIAFYAPAT